MLRKVFLVEDETVIREGLRDRIPWDQFGYRFVGEAADGEMALPLIRKTKPDVLITDIKMPFMDGLSLSKIVSKEFPRMKIIIISGYDDFEYARQAIEVGVDQYLLKPVTRMKLKNVLLELKDKIEQDQEQEDYRTQFQNEIQEYEQFSRRRFMEKILEGELSVKEIYDEAERQSIEITAAGYNLLFLYLQEKNKDKMEGFLKKQDEVLHYFLRYPQYYHSIDRKIYTYKFRKACENADKIIAISECTKRDIIEYFRIPADKIEVVYQGCDPSFMHPVAAEKKREIRAKYQLPDHYILNVGSIEERKNALSAVQALTMLPEQIHLVIVGRHTEYTDKIERFIKENKLEERVHIISNVPFDDLPTFYQLAEIFVYPSRFEGFGIPIIEALYSGIPVVAATGSCLEEAGGPDSIYIHPDDIKGMANAFKQIYSDTERKKEMIEKGQKFAKRFSEEKQAEEILNIYKKLMK